jgi:hypothetical protein
MLAVTSVGSEKFPTNAKAASSTNSDVSVDANTKFKRCKLEYIKSGKFLHLLQSDRHHP